jgi:hypothetical protein
VTDAYTAFLERKVAVAPSYGAPVDPGAIHGGDQQLNILLMLWPEEVKVLMDHHADTIGQGDEAASDRACARIEELQRLTAPERRYSIEAEPEQQ